MFILFQVQFTWDLERYFIKENEYELKKINEIQKDASLKDYKSGNIILLIHLDFTQTK
jgi:hypothetical protein